MVKKTYVIHGCVGIVKSIIIFSLLIVLLQDILVYPLLPLTYFSETPSTPKLPPTLEQVFLNENEGPRVEAWFYPAEDNEENKTALFFHGNGDLIDHTFGMLNWIRAQGFHVMAVEYRGYGRSEGYPTEEGHYADALAAWNFLQSTKGALPEKTLLFGHSMGTGVASHLARVIEPKALVLLSAYTSIDDVARGRGFEKFFVPFLWSHYPTKENLQGVADRCVIAAHGMRDRVIPYSHFEEIEAIQKPNPLFVGLSSEQAGHNNLMNYIQTELQRHIQECFGRS